MTADLLAQLPDLAHGKHDHFEKGACLLEAVSYVAGEPFTDHPACVSPVLGAYGRGLNDALPNDRRQELKPFIPRPINPPSDDGKDATRGYLALDWLIRSYTPAWLDLAGLTEEAQTLRDLRRIADLATATEAGPVIKAAEAKASAARSAARSAAESAAESAARSAAESAAESALQPTVDELQTSAIALFDVMILDQ